MGDSLICQAFFVKQSAEVCSWQFVNGIRQGANVGPPLRARGDKMFDKKKLKESVY